MLTTSLLREARRLGASAAAVASRRGLAVGSPLRKSATPDYPYYIQAQIAMPRNRIPRLEKAFWGVFIGATILSVPAWIMVHHREYGQSDEE